MFALLQAFNANMVASSRMLFALSRRGLLYPKFARIHPRNQIPSTAIIAVGISTILAMLLGEAGLVPILEVGAVTSAVAWMAACASYWRMGPSLKGRLAAGFGLLVTSLMILVKLVPLVPGHFTRYEWMAMAIWLGLGAALRIPAATERAQSAQASAVGGQASAVSSGDQRKS
jgi:amino acid transporter